GADALSIITTTGAAGYPAWRSLVGGGVSDVHEETESFALFGQIGYDITDRLRVSAEGRWTTETKSVDSVAVNGLLDPAPGPVTSLFSDERDFENFVPRFTVEYDLAEDVLVYASAAEAIKVG